MAALQRKPLQASQDATTRIVANGIPRDVNAVPQEAVIASLGAWRFVAVGNVPLIARRAGGTADGKRNAFLNEIPPLRAGAVLPLDFYAREIGRLWGTRLPPDFPAAYRPDRAGSTPSAQPDLVAAIVCMMRIGLLVVDGASVDAVTRTNRHPSSRGFTFIRNEEGLAPRIYWPNSDNSGVTVGPGYDIGSRSPQDVVADLTSIGISTQAASVVAIGAGLKGASAGSFAKQNKNALNLSLLQQQMLFNLVVPSYEDLVCKTAPKSLPSRLFQHEFDALLSLAWNLRRYGHYTFNSDLAALDFVKADPDIRTLVGGGPGIPPRRVRETLLLTNAIYQFKEMALRNIDIDFYDDVLPNTVSNG